MNRDQTIAPRRRALVGLRCAYCHDDLTREGWTCRTCGTRLHADCRALHGQCTTLACMPESTKEGLAARRRLRAPSAAAAMKLGGLLGAALLGGLAKRLGATDRDVFTMLVFVGMFLGGGVAVWLQGLRLKAAERSEGGARREGQNRGRRPARSGEPALRFLPRRPGA